jgi:hypothetical protein
MRRSRVLALVVALGGCTPDFDDPTTVKDLRLLAIAADTPEVIVDLPRLSLDGISRPEDLAALLAELSARLPPTFPPITLQPLVVDPAGGGRPVHVRAVTCANSPTGPDQARGPGLVMGGGRIRDTIDRDPCPPDSPLLAEEEATPAAEATDGIVPVAVSLVVAREQLALALAGDPLGAVYGLPITVQITASAGDEPHREEVVARKRVVFVQRLFMEQTPNQNPVITGLTLRLSDDDPGVRFDLQDPLADPPSIPLGARVTLEPDRGVQEIYPTMVTDRRTGALSLEFATEALRYAFFASAGTFSPATTSTEPSPVRNPPRRPLATRYQAPLTLPADSDLVYIWVVNRDERAGASFVRVALRLVP